MLRRTVTKDDPIISLAEPDGRIYDFSKSQDDPHAVGVTIPQRSTYEGLPPYWSEQFGTALRCIQGRCHTFEGTGLYSNVDSFFGSGSSESYAPFTLHYWQREEQWQTGKRVKPSRGCSKFSGIDSRPSCLEHDLARRCGQMEEGIKGIPVNNIPKNHRLLDEDLIVELYPNSRYDKSISAKRHELLYRQWASMEHDKEVYPSLPTTPLPIRLIFKLPSFLFPKLLRDYLIAWFLAVQLYTLYSSRLDYHPYLGSIPFTTIYALLYFPKYWLPFGPRLPEWICRVQWTSMLLVSHVKIAFWSNIGKWFLGMKETYDEYTPERLKDALEDQPGEARYETKYGAMGGEDLV